MSGRKKPPRREVFVFTPDEKRAAACVLGAFVLGLATMYYRANNPRPPPPPSAAEQREAKRAATRTRAARESAVVKRTAPETSRDQPQSDEGSEDE